MSTFEVLAGKPKGKGPVERPRATWEGNIRMDLREIGIKTRIGLIRLGIGIIESSY